MRQLAVQQVAASDPGLRDALIDAQLPVDDLTDEGGRFFRFDVEGRVAGYGGFEIHGAHALVRSVVVLPGGRGSGLGRAVTEEILARAAAAGCAEVFLLTPTAELFFEHMGFVRLERAAAPVAILATRQASTICSTATLMTRRVDG